MALADRRESLDRDRVSAADGLDGYLDVGDPSHYRPDDRALVLVGQSVARTIMERSNGQPGIGLRTQRDHRIRYHPQGQSRGRILWIVRERPAASIIWLHQSRLRPGVGVQLRRGQRLDTGDGSRDHQNDPRAPSGLL